MTSMEADRSALRDEIEVKLDRKPVAPAPDQPAEDKEDTPS